VHTILRPEKRPRNWPRKCAKCRGPDSRDPGTWSQFSGPESGPKIRSHPRLRRRLSGATFRGHEDKQRVRREGLRKRPDQRDPERPRLAARGSRLAARGSQVAARGSRLAARGPRLAARGSRLASLSALCPELAARSSQLAAPPPNAGWRMAVFLLTPAPAEIAFSLLFTGLRACSELTPRALPGPAVHRRAPALTTVTTWSPQACRLLLAAAACCSLILLAVSCCCLPRQTANNKQQTTNNKKQATNNKRTAACLCLLPLPLQVGP